MSASTSTAATPAISVVVATYNRSATLAETLAHLERQGYASVNGQPPAYIAQLDYYQRPVADDDGSNSSLSIGVGGGSGGYHGGGVGVGIGTSFDLGGSGSQTAMRTVTLWIDHVETGERVFEARVKSLGPARNFPSAIPYMIDAAFDDFPGQNGTTITIETEVVQN